MIVLDDKTPPEVEVAFPVATIILRSIPAGLFCTKKCSDVCLGFFFLAKGLSRENGMFSLCPIKRHFWVIADAGLTSQVSFMERIISWHFIQKLQSRNVLMKSLIWRKYYSWDVEPTIL